MANALLVTCVLVLSMNCTVAQFSLGTAYNCCNFPGAYPTPNCCLPGFPFVASEPKLPQYPTQSQSQSQSYSFLNQLYTNNIYCPPCFPQQGASSNCCYPPTFTLPQPGAVPQYPTQFQGTLPNVEQSHTNLIPNPVYASNPYCPPCYSTPPQPHIPQGPIAPSPVPQDFANLNPSGVLPSYYPQCPPYCYSPTYSPSYTYWPWNNCIYGCYNISTPSPIPQPTEPPAPTPTTGPVEIVEPQPPLPPPIPPRPPQPPRPPPPRPHPTHPPSTIPPPQPPLTIPPPQPPTECRPQCYGYVWCCYGLMPAPYY